MIYCGVKLTAYSSSGHAACETIGRYSSSLKRKWIKCLVVELVCTNYIKADARIIPEEWTGYKHVTHSISSIIEN